MPPTWKSCDMPEKVDMHAGSGFTQDLDFGLMLMATDSPKPSVVQLRAQDVLPKSIGGRVVDALRQMETELDEGALVTVDLKKTRLRVLPLTRRD